MDDLVTRKYGWKPDLPDYRDEMCQAPMIPVASLPPVWDISNPLVPIMDQGQLGSCTANATGAAHMFEQVKQQQRGIFTPSRLFMYYNGRAMEGTVDEDSGCMIRDVVKSVAKKGVCPEEEWPYDIAKFKDKPPSKCYKHGLGHQALLYSRVAQIGYHIQTCLFQGFPVVYGFSVYESFETQEVARTGRVPMPSSHDAFMGGHANLLVGYNNITRLYKSQNSYGLGHGDKGFLYLPFEYVEDPGLARDFWKITLVE